MDLKCIFIPKLTEKYKFETNFFIDNIPYHSAFSWNILILLISINHNVSVFNYVLLSLNSIEIFNKCLYNLNVSMIIGIITKIKILIFSPLIVKTK